MTGQGSGDAGGGPEESIRGPAPPWREAPVAQGRGRLTAWPRALAGGRVKTWKRRWFILTDSCLYYFEFTTVSLSPHLPQPLPEPSIASPPRAWGPLPVIRSCSTPILQKRNTESRRGEGAGPRCSAEPEPGLLTPSQGSSHAAPAPRPTPPGLDRVWGEGRTSL